jgi:hypothetical protein
MKAYHNTAVLKFDDDTTGNAASGALVTVRINSSQALASIFDVDDVAIGNPLTTDSNGNYAFKVTDNIYDIIVSEGTANEVKLEKVEISEATPTERVVPFSTTDDAINSTDTTKIFDGASLNIEEYATGRGGGGAWDVVLTSTVTTNGRDILISNVLPLLSVVRRNAPKAAVSFIFDDGHISHVNDLQPLFDSKGVKCGFAPTTKDVGSSGLMSATDFINLNKDGYEFINHSFSHTLLNSDKEPAFVKAEVDTAWAYWNNLGIDIKSFLTPASVLGANSDGVIRERYGFAYTRRIPGTEVMRDFDRYLLDRQDMETLTEQECKDSIDDAFIYGGACILYAHDVPNPSVIYTLTETLIDYAQSVGIDILLPTAALKHAVKGYNDNSSDFISGKTIFNNREGWTCDIGTVLVDGNLDIYVTSTSIGQALISRTFDINLEDLGGMTFSTAFRTFAGAVGVNNAIGIKVTDIATTDVLYQEEGDLGTIDNFYRRYNLNVGTFNTSTSNGKVTVLLFLRCDFLAIGDEIFLRDPILRYGNDVTPLEQMVLNDSSNFAIPDQTIANGTVITEVALTNQADNGLYEISGNRIRFTKACKVTINACLMSFGFDTLIASQGGMMFLDYSQGSSRAPLTTATYSAGGSIDLTLNATSGENIRVSMFNVATDFQIKASQSIVTIKEIID